MDIAPALLEVSKTQLENIFRALKLASARSLVSDCSARQVQLKALDRLLRENLTALSNAISQDFGNRSLHETQMLEIFPSLDALRGALKHLRGWMKPQRGWASTWFLPARTEIRYQPLGVVGIIVPWNYPILLAIAPLVAALAAGNRVMIKMSEFTPHTGELVAALMARYFSSDLITVVNGGAETGKAFASLPFDHLLFTGSTAVGRHVMRAAADNLTPVTLELGGKSPVIIGPDFPVALAAERIMWGKCLNAGQTCIAPDYVLLPGKSEAEFIAAARVAVGKLYPRLKNNPDYSTIASDRHVQRLEGYLDDARAKGAAVSEINPAEEDLSGCRKVAPTLVTHVNDAMRIMQDEIFGPLLPLLTYESLDDAICYVNQHPRPLALYYFGYDQPSLERVLSETVAGGVTVNETILHISQDHLPFGGVGPSGMGHYHGRFGFETFSKAKPVFRQSRLNGLKLFHPPFGKRFEALIRLLLR